MIDAVWVQVLQRIPADYYDSLAVITVTGAELVIQQIFKIERDFMVMRARTSGTGDLGRTVIIAFSQIDFVAFNKKMTEEEVLKVFGEPMPEIALPQPAAYQPVAYAMPPSAPPPAAFNGFNVSKPAPAAAAAPVEPIPLEEPVPVEAPAPQQKPGQISKTILLARLRERLAEKAR
jgi:hypothetical protein